MHIYKSEDYGGPPAIGDWNCAGFGVSASKRIIEGWPSGTFSIIEKNERKKEVFMDCN